MEGVDQLERIDFLRLDAGRKLNGPTRSDLGQFLTPAPLASFMASMFLRPEADIRLLDAGAGVGSLLAAFVFRSLKQKERPVRISATAYEIDAGMIPYLMDTAKICSVACEREGVAFECDVRNEDFLAAASSQLSGGLFRGDGDVPLFNRTILNPPYKKINGGSASRIFLRQAGIETSNLYAGFLALAVQLLEPGGEMVAITPRSFCNGPYFRPFRQAFLHDMELRRLHVFESRQQAFRGDDVLQENVILNAIKKPSGEIGERPAVTITSSSEPDDDLHLSRTIPYETVVRPGDRQSFIHVAADELSGHVADRMSMLTTTLPDLGLTVSTGRVVDFRAKEFLRDDPGASTVPLIWPTHFEKGYIAWPKETRKPNYIVDADAIQDQLVPNSPYVLVRRFSAKEEKRRIVAAVHDPARIDAHSVGFENHLNYFHHKGGGIGMELARGLAAYLNSTLVDSYFRQFNGHTQVNATDLRSLTYPTEEQLRAIGCRIDVFPEQSELDKVVGEELQMANMKGIDPVKAKEMMDAALAILKDLGFPKAQQNERSALTLLSLLDLTPGKAWRDASEPLRGITPMMDFFAEHYGKKYAPNSRETVRRGTVHQFLDAGMIIANPDDPERAVNSGKNVYQIEPSVLELLRTYGTSKWQKKLRTYLASVETLAKRYAQERQMTRIPLELPGGKTISLSPGGQNILVERIINEFAPCFTPGGVALYVGDTDEKFAHFDIEALKKLGVTMESHGKMPDIIIHFTKKNWLVLIEAVTSHGPINPKRRDELKKLFSNSTAGLVYVTAFLTRKTMTQYLNEISWETEVWVAESPTHMIHFNGERFLGPYHDA